MARSGLYVKLDTNFPDDDKIEAVGLDGAGLYAMALCVAKRVMTDGRLTRAKVRKLGGSDDLIDRLISVGLLTADPATNDVWITAWLAHNDEAAQIEQRRAEDAARKRLSRAKRPDGHADSGQERPGAVADLEEKRREEKRTTSSSGDDGFEDWWRLYPRKVAKAEARRAWTKARRTKPAPSLADLKAALMAQVRLWGRENRQQDKVPHAATWLNGRRWEDDDLKSKAATDAERDPAGGAW